MRPYISSLMFSVFAIAACSHSGNSSPAAPPPPAPVTAAPVPYGFAEDFHIEANSAAPLTPAQKSSIIDQLNRDALVRPADDLYFHHYDNTTTGDTQKAADLAGLSSDGRDFFDNVRSDCSIVAGDPVTSGDVGLGKTQKSELDRSISGSACPMAFTSTDISVITPSAYSTAQANGHTVTSMSLESSETVSSTESIIDPDMNKNLIINASADHKKTDISYNGLQVDETGKILAGTSHVRTSDLADNTLTNGIGFKSTVKMEYSGAKDQIHIQMLFKAEFSDGRKLVIGTFVDNGAISILVNGEAYTAARLQKEYKIDLAGASEFGRFFLIQPPIPPTSSPPQANH